MSTGFLITNLSGRLGKIKNEINKNFLKKLFIYISVDKNLKCIKNSEWVSRRIADMYTSSCHLFPNLDVRILLNELKLYGERVTKISDYNVNVVLVPKDCNDSIINTFNRLQTNLSVVYIDELLEDEDDPNKESTRSYNNVVLGGTFDRFHTGHKILLSEALLRCSKKLTVGVTDGDMIKHKKLWELIEHCSKRIEAVEGFIKDVDSTVTYEVVPITDMYGPTKNDPHMNMIVVSSETHKGGLKVNEIRKQNGLNELDIHVIELAEDIERSDEEEQKISSSNARMRLLGTYLKIPENKTELSKKPYIIGLTGGVASGKSSICKYLKNLGAGVIDCDKIGHELYKPGSELYNELVQIFGKGIVSENGEINRKELGRMVFNDFGKLQTLNNLMWPAILKNALNECENLYLNEKKEIVVLEAAVLLRAGWDQNVNEVWATIIPKPEAIKRVMVRNGLTETEANSRVEAQPSNSELVEAANVVFCSLWSYEFTRQQVDKAWNLLHSRISKT